MSKPTLLNGTAVRTEKGAYYIKNGKRMVIPSRSVLKSWRFKRVAKYTEADLSHYPVFGKLGFRDGTLIYCMGDALYYIIAGNKRYLVDGPGMLKDHGLKMRDAFIVSKKERDLHGEAK